MIFRFIALLLKGAEFYYLRTFFFVLIAVGVFEGGTLCPSTSPPETLVYDSTESLSASLGTNFKGVLCPLKRFIPFTRYIS